MSSSCCGGSSAPEAKIAAAVPQTTKVAKVAHEQSATKSNKSECCSDEPTKSEKHGCGC